MAMTKIHTPKLRFPEFSEDWIYSSWEALYSFVPTNSLSRENLNYENGSVKNIHYGDIHTHFNARFLSQKEAVPYINVDISSEKFHRCEQGDIIIADASEDYDDIGKSIEIIDTNNDEIVAGLHTLHAKPKTKKVILGYGAYLMASPALRNGIKLNAQGTKVLGITAGRINSLNFAIPSLPEQKKIAAFLASVDTKIGLLEREKSLFEEYKKGCMQQLFSQEVRFRTDDGRQFPDWKKMSLQDAAEINPRVSELPDVFRYIDLERVSNGLLLECETVKRDEAPSRAQRYLNKNDVIFQLVRPYQKNNYHFKLDGDYVASTGYAVIRAKEAAGFLYQLLHTDGFVNRVLERCTGSNYPAINSSELAGIEIEIPHPKEQYKIAEFLSATDRKIELIGIEIEKAEAFKRGLLQQMFL